MNIIPRKTSLIIIIQSLDGSDCESVILLKLIYIKLLPPLSLITSLRNDSTNSQIIESNVVLFKIVSGETTLEIVPQDVWSKPRHHPGNASPVSQ